MAEGEHQSGSRIFVSYRRDDSAGFVRALLGPLRNRFGNSRIFKDTDNIPPGKDFVKVIQHELESCKVLLAIIGKEWVTAEDPRTGTRRLDNPDDTLRVEVVAALENEHTTVIPVLVDRANMPASEDLPENLRPLARRNALELSDSRWDTDVERLVRAIDVICNEPVVSDVREPADAGARPVADPGARGFERLGIKRKRQIAEHIKAAREAWEIKDFQEVLAACERAIWLDPQEPEARELAARAQAALDEQSIQERLAEAQQALSKGELSAASEAIDQALARSPNHPDAIKLRQEMLRLLTERDRQREVNRQVSVAMKNAQTALDDEDCPAALSHVDDALALAPDSRDALDLKAKIVAARDEFLRQRDLRRRAQQAVAEAQAEFSAGQHDAALARLSQFSPPYELVSQALQTLQKRVAEIQDAAEKAKTEAAEAAARARRDADAKLTEASTAFQRKDFVTAQGLVEAAGALDPSHDEIAGWVAKIRDAVAAEAAAAQRRRERAEQEAREAAARARRDADAKLTEAATAFQRKDFATAQGLVEAARALDPTHDQIAEWAAKIRDAVAAEATAAQRRRERAEQEAREAAARARRDADAKLTEAATAFQRKDFATAQGLVDAARALDPTHDAIVGWVAKIRDAVAAEAAAEQRRREREKQERDAAARARRDADARLAKAATAFQRKDFATAQGLVEAARALDPTHDQIAEWAAKIRDAVAAEATAAQRRRERAEQEAREAAARARRGADAKLAEAATALQRKDFATAQELVEAARALDPTHDQIAEWAAKIRDAVAAEAAAAQRRRERAEQEAREAAARARRGADAKLAEAATALQRKDFATAQELVEAARALDPTHDQIAEWAAKIRDAVAAEAAAAQRRREREEQEAREAARQAAAAEQARRAKAAQLEQEEAARRQELEARQREAAAIAARPPVEQRHPADEGEREEAGTIASRPAWIKYLAAAAVLGVAVIVAGVLLSNGSKDGATQERTAAPTEITPNNAPTPVDASRGGTTAATTPPVRPGGEQTTKPSESNSQRASPPGPTRTDSPPRTPGSPAQTGASRSETPAAGSGPADRPRGGAPGSQARTDSAGGGTTAVPPKVDPPRNETSAGPAQADQSRGGMPPNPLPSDPQRGGVTPGGSAPVEPPRGGAPAEPTRPLDSTQLAKSEIQQLLNQYVVAYREMSDRDLKAIDPSFRGIPRRELIKSVSLTLGQPQIDVSPDGQSAILKASGSFNYVWNRAGLPATTAAQLTWTLQKRGTRWTVVSSN